VGAHEYRTNPTKTGADILNVQLLLLDELVEFHYQNIGSMVY
jgi:hypothetical protein